MSPEFLDILGERVYVARWVVFLPICLGLLAVIISAVKSRKGVALLYVTVLAIASVLIPAFKMGLWMDELSNIAKSDEETGRLIDMDSSFILGAGYTFIVGAVFWLISVLVLSVRVVITRIRKREEKRDKDRR